MGKYDKTAERVGWNLPTGDNTGLTDDDLAELMALTLDDDPMARRLALKNLCPCHVKANHPEVWERVLEMVDDPDPRVRDEVVHALGDGSPKDRVLEVVAAADKLRNDRDKRVRRRAQRILRSYHRTGKVNVL